MRPLEMMGDWASRRSAACSRIAVVGGSGVPHDRLAAAVAAPAHQAASTAGAADSAEGRREGRPEGRKAAVSDHLAVGSGPRARCNLRSAQAPRAGPSIPRRPRDGSRPRAEAAPARTTTARGIPPRRPVGQRDPGRASSRRPGPGNSTIFKTG